MHQKKKILIVCASEWNRYGMALNAIKELCDVAFHSYDYNFHQEKIPVNPAYLLRDILTISHEEQVNGFVVSKDYPGALFASVAAKQLDLLSPSPEAVIACQHKYMSRQLQQKYVPEATPRFALVYPWQDAIDVQGMVFPLFIKPVRSNFSFLAQRICTYDELIHFMRMARITIPFSFFSHIQWVMHDQQTASCGDQCTCRACQSAGFLLEECLDGVQVTLEVVVQADVQLVGIVDSVMFPGTISFSRFAYPSALPLGVQERMFDIAKRFVHGVCFDNGLLNIEFMYNPVTDEIHIIEVNPRMVQQFADMMEKVDGTSTYEHAVRVALGFPVQVRKGEGKDGVAASFPLRVFEDKRVIGVPSSDDCDKVRDRFDGAEIYFWIEPGKRLSDYEQDGQSYCYGRINLGARDEQELEEKFHTCMRLLPFEFV